MNSTETASVSVKKPQTAFMVEWAGGIFGLLGLGYFYIGRTEEAMLHLVVWLLSNLVFWGGSYLLYHMNAAFGYICLPLLLLFQVAIPYLSAKLLKENLLYLSS